MPWCPKCKNEYKDGYTVCADCGATLVEKEFLTEDLNNSVNDFHSEAENVMAPNVTNPKIKNMEPAKVYVEAEKQADNYKSGAYSLLIVGMLGLIFIITMWMGVLPLHFSQFNKIVLTVVMGSLFALFIYQGIDSFKLHKKYTNEAVNEKSKEKEIFDFLKKEINPEQFDEDLLEEDISDEILYFKRIDKMKELLHTKGFDLEESFENYILETVYTEIFE